MTTKQITNEMIFDRLGWIKEFPFGATGVWCWTFQGEDMVDSARDETLPDPLHDLNAAFKYVAVEIPPADLGEIVRMAMTMPRENLPLAICQAFMDLPVEEKK